MTDEQMVADARKWSAEMARSAGVLRAMAGPVADAEIKRAIEGNNGLAVFLEGIAARLAELSALADPDALTVAHLAAHHSRDEEVRRLTTERDAARAEVAKLREILNRPDDPNAPGVVIELVAGPEGKCIVINDTRVAGPKPWGGGTVVQTWRTTSASMRRAYFPPASDFFDLTAERDVALWRAERLREALLDCASSADAAFRCGDDGEPMRELVREIRDAARAALDEHRAALATDRAGDGDA